VSPGQLVAVPFGPRVREGFVVSLSETCDLPPEKLKPLLRPVREEPVVLPDLMELAEWMHVRYLCNLVDALRLMLPAEMRGGRVREKTVRHARLTLGGEALKAFIENNRRAPKQLALIERLRGGDVETGQLDAAALRALVKKGAVQVYEGEARRTPLLLAGGERAEDPEPMPEQRAAVARLTAALESGGGRFLLHGVTGSGKTEVYIQLIRRAMELGRTAIVLVPEIALTPQMVTWLHGRFGGDAAVLHSALSAGERFDEWRRIRDGKARVVVGPRSAVFAPVEKLGLIVVDEEHEPSYKQDESPRYNARDVAVMRAHVEKAAIILGSATPSLESWNNANTGKYLLARLSRRAAEDAQMPLVHIVDMRREVAETGRNGLFSRALMDAIHDRLSRGEQTLLFLNRRGYATSLVCPSCGYVATCEACDIPFTYHKRDDCLRCHICGTWRRVSAACPSCGDRNYKCLGTGTQRIEEIVAKCFPRARIARMDADSTSRKFSHDDILGDFKAGRTDILIGTQMIAKGLHFPNVTLAGILSADTSLHIPDFRAGERTFQLLAQVSGRTGRGAIAGEVFVQTYTPSHPAVQMARTENFAAFAKGELASRRELGYPPFAHLARIALHGPDETETDSLLGRIAAAIRARAPADVKISDVVPSSLVKACDQYRYEIIMRAPSVARMEPAIVAATTAIRVPDRMRLVIDIDAISVC
jgi:primosomal protein N' (replication factor Y)